MSHLGINQIIVDIMVFFMIIGAVDRITKKKFLEGMAKEFEDGFHALGSLALSMLGILAIAPVLTQVLLDVLGPFYQFVGADPAMMAGTFLGMDMGAYSIAHQMAASEDVANLSGLIMGGMMGNTIVFIIPVAMGILKKDDYGYLAQGILYGVITIPIGCILGGLAAGYSLAMILHNIVPIIIVVIPIALGLKFKPQAMIKGFRYFGDFVVAGITFALMIAIIQTLCGITIIKGMAPLSEGFDIIGHIAIMLAGAFPMVYIVKKTLGKPLEKAGSLIGLNDAAATGIVASLANNIPTCNLMKNMNVRGKIINGAFLVSGTFILGDDLAFVASVNRSMIIPMIVAKGTAGLAAIALAWSATRKLQQEQGDGNNKSTITKYAA